MLSFLLVSPPSVGASGWSVALQVALLAITVWQLVLWLYRWLAMSDLERKARPVPQAPGELPVLGNFINVMFFRKGIRERMVAKAEEFQGRVFFSTMIGRPKAFVATTPELFEDVLKTQFECFDKGENQNDVLQDLLGDGIFAVDGHKWVRQRKTASNLFTANALRDSMTKSVHKLLPVLDSILQRSVDTKQPVPMVRLLNRFTMEAFTEIGFGVELGYLDADEEHPFQAAFDSAQRLLITRFIRPKWFWKTQRWFNIGYERELKEKIRLIDDTVLRIIAQSLENRNHPQPTNLSRRRDGHSNIVSLFLDNVGSFYSDKASVDPVFLRDIVVNFLIAGRDTTAQALSWFFYMLSEHPNVEQKIRAELSSQLPELVSGVIAAPSMEQTHHLVYLEAALRETLRLYPSVPMNSKQANRDTVLCDGTFVKKGSLVRVSSYLMGRMPHVWGLDAKEFKPERWIDVQTGKITAVSAYKFNSFHAGPRMCLGMNLAMLEMKILAASVLSKFQLQIVPGQEITYDFSLTLPMKGPLMVQVVPADISEK